jgi:hypothetical protein
MGCDVCVKAMKKLKKHAVKGFLIPNNNVKDNEMFYQCGLYAAYVNGIPLCNECITKGIGWDKINEINAGVIIEFDNVIHCAGCGGELTCTRGF